MSKGPIEFYYDFSSPYGYIGAMRIEDIAAAHDREVLWRPILLGVIFKATNAAPLTTVPLKGDYSKHDFARTARYYNIPFKMPSKFPIPSQAPARGHYWLEEQDTALAKRFSLAVFNAFFVEDKDVSSPEVAADIAQALGVDRSAFLDAIASAPIKQRLKDETQAAIDKGICGSPGSSSSTMNPSGGGPSAHAVGLVGARWMVMKKGIKQLVAEAESEIRSLSPAEAHAMMDDPNVQIVDIRDVRELDRKGMIPGALHAPRGMLEFWVDPESPYHKPAFATGQMFVFYCAGGLRSALATKTVQDMGLAPVAHIGGGFAAWEEAQLPTAPRPPSHPSSKKTG